MWWKCGAYLSNSARLTPAVNAEVGEGVVLDVVFSSQFPTPETGYGAWAPGEHQHTKPASPSKQARSCALVNHLGDLSECDTRATKRNAEIRGVITTVAQSSGPLPQRMLPLHLLCPAVYDLWWHLVLWIPWFWSGVVLLRWHTCGLRRIRRSWRLSSWSIVHLWGNRFLILLIRVTARHLVRWLHQDKEKYFSEHYPFDGDKVFQLRLKLNMTTMNSGEPEGFKLSVRWTPFWKNPWTIWLNWELFVMSVPDRARAPASSDSDDQEF